MRTHFSINAQAGPTLKLAIKLAAISFAGSILVSFLVYVLNTELEGKEKAQDFPDLLYMFMTLILSPIIETLLLIVSFKIFEFGFSFFWKKYATVTGLILASLLFAVLHAPNRPAFGLAVLWPGLVFSYAYVLARTTAGVSKSAIFSMAVHGMHNLAALSLMLLGVGVSRMFTAA
jgi:membrane protease YdiL (CAAX protease family)